MVAPTIYLTGGTYARVTELPGLKVILSSGPGPVDGDTQIQGREVYFPSPARMLLDAMAPAPRYDDPQYSRKISAEEIEERLISICDSRGEQAFRELRERAKVVGAQLNTPKARLEELDRLMGAILGTRPNRKMPTSNGTGRARGYDAYNMPYVKSIRRGLQLPAIARLARPTFSLP